MRRRALSASCLLHVGFLAAPRRAAALCDTACADALLRVSANCSNATAGGSALCECVWDNCPATAGQVADACAAECGGPAQVETLGPSTLWDLENYGRQDVLNETRDAVCNTEGGRFCAELDCRPKRSDAYTCSECKVDDGGGVICTHDYSERQAAAVGIGVVASLIVVGAVAGCVLLAPEPAPPHADTGLARRAGKRRSHSHVSIADAPASRANPFARFRYFFLRGMSEVGRRQGGGTGHRALFAAGVTVPLALLCGGVAYAEMDDGSDGGLQWVPEGGRLSKEIAYWNKHRSDIGKAHMFRVVIGFDDDRNVLTGEGLDMMFNVLRRLQQVVFKVYATDGTEHNVSWNSTCIETEHKVINAIMGGPGPKPCFASPTALDCFLEGSWQFQAFDALGPAVTSATPVLDSPDVGGGLRFEDPGPHHSLKSERWQRLVLAAHGIGLRDFSGYRDRRSYRNMSDDQVRRVVSRSYVPGDGPNGGLMCRHMIRATSPPRAGLFGDYEVVPTLLADLLGRNGTGLPSPPPEGIPVVLPAGADAGEAEWADVGRSTGVARPADAALRQFAYGVLRDPAPRAVAIPAGVEPAAVADLFRGAGGTVEGRTLLLAPADPTEGLLTSATKFIARLKLLAPYRAITFGRFEGVSQATVAAGFEEWLTLCREEMERADKDIPGASITFFHSDTFDELAEDIAGSNAQFIVIGYALMVALVILSQLDFRFPPHNLAAVGLLGVVMVVMAFVASLGLLSLCGVMLNRIMMQVLPFLALALGVDDIFLLLHYFRGIELKGRPTSSVIAELLEHGGSSVTLTSLCNTCAFFGGTLVPIPALNAFLLAAGTTVILNYFAVVVFIPVALAVHCECTAGKEGCCGEMDLSPRARQAAAKAATITGMCETKVLPLLSSLYVRVGISVGAVTMFVVLCTLLFTAHPLEFDIDYIDIAQSGSYIARGIDEAVEYVFNQESIIPYFGTLDVNFSKPEHQNNMKMLHTALQKSPWAHPTSQWDHWLTNVNNYARTVTCPEGIPVMPCPLKPCPNPCIVENPDNPDLSYIPGHRFYDVYHHWRNPVTGGMMSVQAIFTDDFGYSVSLKDYQPNNTLTLMSALVRLQGDKMISAKNKVQMLDDFRALFAENFSQSSTTDAAFWPSPEGYWRPFEEYFYLREFFWTTFALSSCVLLVAAIVVPVSIRGACIIAVTSAMCVIEIAALCMAADIGFSMILATTLLMSIGICVEFSAHVVVSFEAGSGDRLERMRHAVSCTFVPVLEGGISSFLGFLPFIFSVYPFVQKYFFVVFVIMIGVGLLHGLVFLPVLLSFVGSSDGPVEGSSSVAPADKQYTAQTIQCGVTKTGEEGDADPPEGGAS